jgi:hypothetical protein
MKAKLKTSFVVIVVLVTTLFGIQIAWLYYPFEKSGSAITVLFNTHNPGSLAVWSVYDQTEKYYFLNWSTGFFRERYRVSKTEVKIEFETNGYFNPNKISLRLRPPNTP